MFVFSGLLPPPTNITASIKDGNLFVTWNLPNTKTTRNPYCFDYQLDVGEHVRHILFCVWTN